MSNKQISQQSLGFNHEELASTLLPFGNSAQALSAFTAGVEGTQGAAALEMLNGEVTKQAAVISYLNDFVLMMYVVLASVPLLSLLRKRKREETRDEVVYEVVDEVATAIE